MANLNLQTISSGDSLDDGTINNNITALNEVALVGTAINNIPTFSYDSKITAEAINNAFTKIKTAWKDVSQTTATPSHVLYTAQFLDKNGNLSQGTMPMGTINAPTISSVKINTIPDGDESNQLTLTLRQKINEGFVNTATNSFSYPLIKRGQGYPTGTTPSTRFDNPIACDIQLSRTSSTSTSSSANKLRIRFPELDIEKVLFIIAAIRSPISEYALVVLNRFEEDWGAKFYLTTKTFNSVSTTTAANIFDNHSIILNTNYWDVWFGTTTPETHVSDFYVDVVYLNI